MFYCALITQKTITRLQERRRSAANTEDDLQNAIQSMFALKPSTAMFQYACGTKLIKKKRF